MIIQACISMLVLADELQNISRACKVASSQGRTPWQAFQNRLAAKSQPQAA